MNRTIMAVGAHADDVEIYFGGTLLKYLDQGYNVVYVQATNNMFGHIREVQPDGSVQLIAVEARRLMQQRKAECHAAAAVFNTTPIHLDHPQRAYTRHDGSQAQLDYGTAPPQGVALAWPSITTAHEDPASVQRVTDLMLMHDPEIIFTHGMVEANVCEHAPTAMLAIKGYWQAVDQGFHGSLLHAVNRFEQLQLGRFNGQWETWVDVTDFVDRRMAAIQKHVSQYPPAFELGARYWRDVLEQRGRACGVGAAEIFNFVNDPQPGGSDGALLSELLRNRAAPGVAWAIDCSCVSGDGKP